MKKFTAGTCVPPTSPKNLIAFSESYKEQLPALVKFVADHSLDKQKIEIPLMRVQPDGRIISKIFAGYIIRKNQKSFILNTCDHYDGKYEEMLEKEIRFDNVLGDIPIHPFCPTSIIPVDLDGKNFLSYYEDLERMRKVLQSCIGSTHAATVIYQVDGSPAGYCQIECEILEVNKSNFKYKNHRTFTRFPNEECFRTSDVCQNVHTECFVTPLRYLSNVSVKDGVTHNVNAYAD